MSAIRLPLAWTLLAVLGLPAVCQEVVFHRRNAQRGDTSRQQLDCDLNLNLSIRQSGQIVQQQDQLLKRQQQRQLTILQADSGAPQQAEVKYELSTVTLKAAQQEAQATQQPVTGKSYLVTRDGDNLSITYPNGSPAPDEERLIVLENMETFGLPNPIATFFDGKAIRVGQTLQLPTELARDLLGFAATSNSVSQFMMKLVEVQPAPPGGSPIAVFAVKLQADDPEDSKVSMTLNGQLAMEVETCRAVSVRLSGPVVASEIHGPEAGQYELHSRGQINVAVKASYTR